MGAATVRVRVSGLRGLFRLVSDGDDGGRPAWQSHRHSQYGVSDSLSQMTSASLPQTVLPTLWHVDNRVQALNQLRHIQHTNYSYEEKLRHDTVTESTHADSIPALHWDNVRMRGLTFAVVTFQKYSPNVMWPAVTTESPLPRTTTVFKDIRAALTHIYRCRVVLQLLLLLAALRAERSSGGSIRDDQRTVLSVQVQRQTLPGEPAVPTFFAVSHRFSHILRSQPSVLTHSSQSAC